MPYTLWNLSDHLLNNSKNTWQFKLHTYHHQRVKEVVKVKSQISNISIDYLVILRFGSRSNFADIRNQTTVRDSKFASLKVQKEM